MKLSVTVTRNELKPLIDSLILAKQINRPLREVGFGWLQLIRQGFATGRNPYGQPWLPVKRGGRPLVRTGALLRDRFAFSASATQVSVGTNVKIAEFHQFGTHAFTILPQRRQALAWPSAAHPVRSVQHPGLPKRQMVPERQGGLPTQYQHVIQTAFARLLPKK
jgi:phage gpG-like protein